MTGAARDVGAMQYALCIALYIKLAAVRLFVQRRGPSLGGKGLRKSDEKSQTRLAVPIDAAPSTSGASTSAGWIELAELYPTI